MSVFPDTGPQPDGTRTGEQWINAISEDMSIAFRNVREALEFHEQWDREQLARNLAIALKETRRLQSDIYRLGDEALGLTRKDIDAIGPL